MKLCMYKPESGDSMQFLQVTLTQDAFMQPGGIYIMTGGYYYIQIGVGNTGKDSVRNQLVEAGKMAVAKLKTLQ